MLGTLPGCRDLSAVAFPPARLDSLAARNGAAHGKPEPELQWKQAIDEIVSFQTLGEDWDGQGASAPSRELLESAIGLAYLYAERRLPAPDCVLPGVTGTVIFEWQSDGVYCEVEILRPFYAEGMITSNGQLTEHWVIPDNDDSA